MREDEWNGNGGDRSRHQQGPNGGACQVAQEIGDQARDQDLLYRVGWRDRVSADHAGLLPKCVWDVQDRRGHDRSPPEGSGRGQEARGGQACEFRCSIVQPSWHFSVGGGGTRSFSAFSKGPSRRGARSSSALRIGPKFGSGPVHRNRSLADTVYRTMG